MSVTYFVLTDIHSFYKAFTGTLKGKGFDINNQLHKIILCGDAFDRGEDPIATYNFLKTLNEQHRLIYIRGNHEDLYSDCLSQYARFGISNISGHHWSNGTVNTIITFNNFGIAEEVNNFINDNCIDYFCLGNYIFVHGWVPCTCNATNKFYVSKEMSLVPLDCWNSTDTYDATSIWQTARWSNGMEAWKQGCTIKDKTIVCGHFHSSWGWSHLRQERKEFPEKNRPEWQKSFEPFIDNGIIALDACTAYSGICNCLVLDEFGNIL